VRLAFAILAEEIKTQINRDRIKSNLSAIYGKTFKQNVGLMFTVWRNVNIFAKVKEN
jgi:hypothetical protein